MPEHEVFIPTTKIGQKNDPFMNNVSTGAPRRSLEVASVTIYTFSSLPLVCRTNEFDMKCNKETVNLESVTEADDLEWLQNILEEFKQATGSEVAASILSDWDNKVKHFIKVSKDLPPSRTLEKLLNNSLNDWWSALNYRNKLTF